MRQELSGKVAVITGAASGIGLECARALLSEGVSVALHRSGRGVTESGSARNSDPGHFPCGVDLTNPESVATHDAADSGKVRESSTSSTPMPAAYIGGDVVEGDPDAWDRMLNLNVNAAFRSVQAVLPHMVERQTGDIIMTSSIAGLVPVVWEPIYTASKFAVQAFVHTVRRQVDEAWHSRRCRSRRDP